MSSIYGIDPIYDYTYKKQMIPIVNYGFPPDSLMHYLQSNHPKFAYIVKKAGYAQRFASLQDNVTIFVPREDSLLDDTVSQFNKDTCVNLIRYHTLRGHVPPSLLQASPYQFLIPESNGQQILCETKERMITLNGSIKVLSYQETKGANIYLIDQLMADAVMGSS
jgi:hypothetical protein